MDIMKCDSCGFENKDSAKFCSKCGVSLEVAPTPSEPKNSNSKVVIALLIVVIVVLAAVIGYFALSNNAFGNNSQAQPASGSANSSNASSSAGGGSSQQVNTSESSSSSSPAKQWVLIGSYSGSGSGTKSINVPAGEIMVKISAYPIKNYATNHLHVSGSNGQSCGVDWGSHSDVETRSDSVTYTSSSPQTFTIDYYETVSWQVDFYRYQ
ncbi:zinc ribbon domain-containing protein [uncultured Methanobrevibacter sp.]|uniref:zinc ribbon domain-containing protein n=1 Tax=uncultured Methanobrevibacter sp. TaxID=253161 RepID=UPI0025D86E88|nr:zinc ribbon domain-containing protein [uncultured Methanobrevibacter sp.]